MQNEPEDESSTAAIDFQDDDEDEERRNNQDENMDDEQDRAHEREERRRYRPYKFSGKTYSFDVNNERTILDELRSWAINYFAKEYVIVKEMYKLLKDLKGGSGEHGPVAGAGSQEFDLLVKILKVFEKDENTLELRIKDISQKMWYMSVPRLKFHPSVIRQGEIVRVRSVELNLTTKRDVIQVKPYTNILRISSHCKIQQELWKAIEDETDTDKLLLDDSSEVLMSSVIYTEITNPTYQN